MAIAVKVNDGSEKKRTKTALSLRPNAAVFYGCDDINDIGDLLYKEDLFEGVRRAVDAESLASPRKPARPLLSCTEFLECLMIIFGFRNA